MFFIVVIYKIYLATSNLNEKQITSEIVIHDFESIKSLQNLDQTQLKEKEEEKSTRIVLKDHVNNLRKISSNYVVDLDVIEEVSEGDSLTCDDTTINYTSHFDLKRNPLYDENTEENDVTKYAQTKTNFKRYFANTGGLGLLTYLLLVVLVLLLFLVFLVPETLRLIFTVMTASLVLISVIMAIYYYWEWYTE
jgi:hypothetical protein